ncbi:MAG: hypothetical protein LBM66_05540, partial [Bifidobacteriaceae bacterium]|nr:hypothetical protein [Bifidobacteriaceae bacterium]
MTAPFSAWAAPAAAPSPSAGGAYGPIAYSWWWIVVGVLLVAAAVAAVLLAAGWFARRRKAKAERPMTLAKARSLALGQVEAAERRHAAGETTLRGLHVELAAAVRGYAKNIAGVDATVLSLTELRLIPALAPVAGAIARYYQPEFAPLPQAEAGASVAHARTLVETWAGASPAVPG